jgi:hypothetical protein
MVSSFRSVGLVHVRNALIGSFVRLITCTLPCSELGADESLGHRWPVAFASDVLDGLEYSVTVADAYTIHFVMQL